MSSIGPAPGSILARGQSGESNISSYEQPIGETRTTTVTLGGNPKGFEEATEKNKKLAAVDNKIANKEREKQDAIDKRNNAYNTGLGGSYHPYSNLMTVVKKDTELANLAREKEKILYG